MQWNSTLITRLEGIEAHRKLSIQRASTGYAGPLHIFVMEREGEREHFTCIANKCLNDFGKKKFSVIDVV